MNYKPVDFGLPEKFEDWRKNQWDIITRIRKSKKRFKLVAAPTGHGKSLDYTAAATLLGGRWAYLTSTKGLQDQLMGDFSSIGMVDIRGKSSYKCSMRPSYTCGDGYHAKCPMRNTMNCPYGEAHQQALDSDHMVTNYPNWIAKHKYSTGFGKFDGIICDEAHTLDAEIAKSLQVLLSHSDILDFLNHPLPNRRSNMLDWKLWAHNARGVCDIVLAGLKNEVDMSFEKPDDKTVKRLLRYQGLSRKLDTLCKCTPQDWVVEESDSGFQFDPVNVAKYAETTVFLGIQNVLLFSATAQAKTMEMLGVSRDEFDFIEVESTFPVENCPTIWVPTARVDRKTSEREWADIYRTVDQIVKGRLDRKGLIHTHRFDIAKAIYEHSVYGKHMILHTKRDNIGELVRQFKASPPPRYLLSPSLETGYDFPYEDAEFQIVCKVPFQDNRNSIVRAREAIDPDYTAYLAMLSLAQIKGRPMRAEDDMAETIILDDNIKWFVKNYGKYAPRWFKTTYKESRAIPRPPRKLHRHKSNC